MPNDNFFDKFIEQVDANIANNYHVFAEFNVASEIPRNLILEHIFGLNKPDNNESLNESDAKRIIEFQPEQQITSKIVDQVWKQLLILFHPDKFPNRIIDKFPQIRTVIKTANEEIQDVKKHLSQLSHVILTSAIKPAYEIFFELNHWIKYVPENITCPKKTWLDILEKTLNCNVANYEKNVGPSAEQFFTAFQAALEHVFDNSYLSNPKIKCQINLTFVRRAQPESDEGKSYTIEYTPENFRENTPEFRFYYRNCQKFVEKIQQFLNKSIGLEKFLFEHQDKIIDFFENKKKSAHNLEVIDSVKEFNIKEYLLPCQLTLLEEISIILNPETDPGDVKTLYLLSCQFIFLDYLKNVVTVPKTDVDYAIKFLLNFIEKDFNFRDFIIYSKNALKNSLDVLQARIKNELLREAYNYSQQVNNNEVDNSTKKAIDDLLYAVWDDIEFITRLGLYFPVGFDQEYIDKVQDEIKKLFIIDNEQIAKVSCTINVNITSRPDPSKFITHDSDQALLTSSVTFGETNNISSEAGIASAATENQPAVLYLTDGSELNHSQSASTKIYKDFIHNVIEVLLAKADYLVDQPELTILEAYRKEKKLGSIPAVADNASLEVKKQHLFLTTAQELIKLKDQPQLMINELRTKFDTILRSKLEEPLIALPNQRSVLGIIKEVISDALKRLVSQHRGLNIYDNFSSKKTLEIIKNEATAVTTSLFFSKPVAKAVEEDSAVDSNCAEFVRHRYL